MSSPLIVYCAAGIKAPVEAVARDWFHEAMRFYEKAEALRPSGNDESILRWNTCARMLGRHEPLRSTRDEYEPALGE